MDIRNATLVFALSMPFSVLAEQARSSQAQEVQAKPEEIVITGQRLQQLRTQMMDAEIKAYDFFNHFNDEKRFNISCSSSPSINSHISRRLCQPEFEIQAMADHAADYYENVSAYFDPANWDGNKNPPPRHLPAEGVIDLQQGDYHHKMKQVAEQHPEFLQAVIEYGKKRDQYEKATTTKGK